jgi:hypothetical protein
MCQVDWGFIGSSEELGEDVIEAIGDEGVLVPIDPDDFFNAVPMKKAVAPLVSRAKNENAKLVTWQTSFWRSAMKDGTPCLFYENEGIEYVFAPDRHEESE